MCSSWSSCGQHLWRASGIRTGRKDTGKSPSCCGCWNRAVICCNGITLEVAMCQHPVGLATVSVSPICGDMQIYTYVYIYICVCVYCICLYSLWMHHMGSMGSDFSKANPCQQCVQSVLLSTKFADFGEPGQRCTPDFHEAPEVTLSKLHLYCW